MRFQCEETQLERRRPSRSRRGSGHLMRARERIGYTAWLGRLLERMAKEDREAVARRADDLLVQAFCSCVLNLALHTGLEQENQTIAAEAFGTELDRVIDEQPERLSRTDSTRT